MTQTPDTLANPLAALSPAQPTPSAASVSTSPKRGRRPAAAPIPAADLLSIATKNTPAPDTQPAGSSLSSSPEQVAVPVTDTPPAAAAKAPAPRNKTITLTEPEIAEYSSRAVTLKGKAALRDIIDKTIWQGTFEALKFLPANFAD